VTDTTIVRGTASTASAHQASLARTEPPAQRATWVEVDRDAIAGNVAALKAQANAPRLMATVKANGYGHGILESARAALAGGADWLGVALVEEGRLLRAAGITAPILVYTEPPPQVAGTLLDADLTPAVYSPDFLAALGDEAVRRDTGPVDVHLKLDTGMRRVGVPQADWEGAFRALADADDVRCAGLWSHFAVADEPGHPFIAHQAEEFARGVALARRLGLRPELVHLVNSAGTLHLHDHHWDMVRPGLAIYGLEPAPGLADGVGLRPALSWRTRLSLVKRLAQGEAVSYGLRWTAGRDTTIGTVPAGYADGVRRALTNIGEAVVHGRRVPYAGTVCMDQLVVDLGDLDAVAGDELCLLGEQVAADGTRTGVTADDWATWLGTINYEIVCGIGPRVPRVYVGTAGTAGTTTPSGGADGTTASPVPTGA
jgi:alanine racemase